VSAGTPAPHDNTQRSKRFADDVVVHCLTERQAHPVREAIGRRFADIGLQLHPDKTRIVYCKDDRRRLDWDQVTFTLCGYAFRPPADLRQGQAPDGLPARRGPGETGWYEPQDRILAATSTHD
jgi:hypothetical protein